MITALTWIYFVGACAVAAIVALITVIEDWTDDGFVRPLARKLSAPGAAVVLGLLWPVLVLIVVFVPEADDDDD